MSDNKIVEGFEALYNAEKKHADRVREINIKLVAALDHVEAVLSIVEPRSHKAEYLVTLSEVRAALAAAKEK